MSERTRVILLHGFAANSLAMMPLRSMLSRRGLEPSIWRYPSLRVSVAENADRLRAHLDDLDADAIPYHIVAHSMGAIVTRAAHADGNARSGNARSGNARWLQRIVFLAPPHSGLPAARLASPIAQRFLPPMLDLSDAPTSYVNTLPTTINHDVGAIAARWDVLVPRRSTHLDCQREHRTLHASHNSLLVSRRVATLVANFLHRGSFDATL